LDIPNASVAVDITNVAGVRLSDKGGAGAINFDVKARLEEKERRSQMVAVNFGLLLTTKPSVVKFEVEGTATLTGKDEEIRKMLEVDPEIKVPYVFKKVYQNAFAAMYLLSTILKTPPPPHNLFPHSQEQGIATEDVEVDSRVGEAITKEGVEQRTDELSRMEGEEAVREGHTEERTAESGAEEPMTERRTEEKTEALSNTRS